MRSSPRTTIQQLRFRKVTCCPCCKGDQGQTDLGPIKTDYYYFGGKRIEALEQGTRIHLKSCPICGLVYKEHMIEPEELTALIAGMSADLWQWDRDYRFLLKIVTDLFPKEKPRVLDVGAHDGSLLKALSPLAGGLSALDIYENKECKAIVNGEYIQQRLDADRLSSSCPPYDLVTMFDVAEHVHNPYQAFENITPLVRRGGFVIIETGDAEYMKASEKNLQECWYLALAEHQVVYSRVTFQWIGHCFGYALRSVFNKANKDFASMKSVVRVRKQLLRALYRLSPHQYAFIREKMGQPTIPPPSMFNSDHILVVLQKM